MRILHIVSTLDPAAGGPAEGVRLLLTHDSDEHASEVLTLDPPDAPFLKDLPFTVHAIGPSATTYRFTPKLYTWLREHRDRFDGYLVNGLWEYCGLATAFALYRRAPYMVFTHGMLDPYFKKAFPLKHLKKVLYWYPFEYWVLRRAYRVLFTTDTERRLAEQSFGLWSWKPDVAPYGILPSSSPPAADVEAFHERVPELRGKRFLLFLGRIHPKKGCDMLVKAFCQVASSDPELHLLMAGPDQTGWAPELKAIAEQAGVQDRIHWPGVLIEGAKWGAFRASEAFILPSHQENFGIAVAEALSCRLPVLLSDQVNIVSLLNGFDCSIVENDTVEGTQQMLTRWIAKTPDERAAMREQAGQCYEARLNLHENSAAVFRLFKNALSGRFDRRDSH
jgi:glycosyltransferase involved in cell wall biosynthesis